MNDQETMEAQDDARADLVEVLTSNGLTPHEAATIADGFITFLKTMERRAIKLATHAFHTRWTR